jgi:hypothetical protein
LKANVEFRSDCGASRTLISGHITGTAGIQWKYRPILINGKPAEVAKEIIVNFTLTPSAP